MSILSSTTLTLTVSSTTNEKVVKDVTKVLKADIDVLEQEFEDFEALAVKKALVVTRDANGRVVSIATVIPDELVEALSADLSAIPGVINVDIVSNSVSPDLPPGTKGIDGSSLTAFTALGFVEVYAGGVVADTVPGQNGEPFVLTQLYGASPASFWEVSNQANPIPQNSHGGSLEMRAQARSGDTMLTGTYKDGAGEAAVNVTESSGPVRYAITVSGYAGDPADHPGAFGGQGQDYPGTNIPAPFAMRTYELVVLPNAGGVQLKVDGVLQTLLNGNGVLTDTLEYIPYSVPKANTELVIHGQPIQVNGINNQRIDIDFIRWTKP